MMIQRGPYRDDVREGVWTEFDRESGLRTAVGPYKKDQRDGLWTEFDRRTGERSAQGSYKENKRHGTWTMWRTNREVVMTYRDGTLDGPYTVTSNGRIFVQKTYREGKEVREAPP